MPDVNLNPFTAESAAIQRRLQMAQALGQQALQPMDLGKIFTDLSYFRNIGAIIGGIIVIIPFSLCFKSVSKFRKMLSA